jgi:hypothetical protein
MRGLTDAFSARGFTVVPAEEAGENVPLVVTGMTENFTGDQRRALKGPVISAEGKTPEEVVREVENAIARMEGPGAYA